MAKYQQRILARQLRQKGVSVGEIAKRLQISKSTASLWVRDIVLTIEQLEKLRQQNIKGGERGRLIGALKQKNERLRRMQKGVKLGKTRLPNLTQQELLIAGTALYWAEGTKKGSRVAFCNSDPKLVQFMITWLQQCFNISKRRICCTVGINESHENRDNEVKQYWSNVIGIPIHQFRKTSLKRVKSKKMYANHNEHFGTLTVEVKKSTYLRYNILGLIEGLSIAQTSG
jgi:transcriptional regulator with XRE-family HTH domain